jgi:cell division protein FtsW
MSATATARATTRRQPPAEYDAVLMWVVLALLCIGLVMVYSASIAIAEGGKAAGYQPTYYLVRQGIFILIGLAAAMAAFQVPVQKWQAWAPWLFLSGVVLLVAVLIPHVGHAVNGSRRWLHLPFINLQPSELMKLFAVLYAADYTVRKSAIKHTFQKAFFPMFAVMGLVGALLLLEPDMGAFFVICVITFCMLWLGGFNLMVFVGLLITLPLAFAALIFSSPYRLQRFKVFMDPWLDPYGSGYQITNALMAIGRGEWFGVGLGGSVGKLFYLPEAHTDFLLAIIGEELGFAGVFAVLALFALLLLRAFAIGRQSAFLDRTFAALVAQGIAVWIGVQAMINIAVNMDWLPTKGLTLPFLSFGGSGIVVNCVAVGILLKIDWENRRMMRGQPI